MDGTATDLGTPGHDLHDGYGPVNACDAVAAVGGVCSGETRQHGTRVRAARPNPCHPVARSVQPAGIRPVR
jgi:hypothetical protein